MEKQQNRKYKAEERSKLRTRREKSLSHPMVISRAKEENHQALFFLLYIHNEQEEGISQQYKDRTEQATISKLGNT